jgi:hypothetical protein
MYDNEEIMEKLRSLIERTITRFVDKTFSPEIDVEEVVGVLIDLLEKEGIR